ncbi:hypothetical protein KM799_08525 [Clostridium tyrobutyricum]|uniref:hypothetical protein n=1 Tax=Clostridium tyrobutyricum TaxID=1519 RepID=UPI001C37FA27|nr:hypothetical protein [Clostridium tyrobutyricum]MBV4446646.1 hypothetical protein [Clostridium tyrobutyricum]
MKKINEKVNFSKQVLGVNIDSPIFQDMINDLNKQIVNVVKQVYDEKFESGDIALKLTLSVPTLTKRFPAENDMGEPTVEKYEYKALQFDHKITTTLKKVDKEDGEYFGEKELKKDDLGNFIESPIEDPQLSMFDKVN